MNMRKVGKKVHKMIFKSQKIVQLAKKGQQNISVLRRVQHMSVGGYLA